MWFKLDRFIWITLIHVWLLFEVGSFCYFNGPNKSTLFTFANVTVFRVTYVAASRFETLTSKYHYH